MPTGHFHKDQTGLTFNGITVLKFSHAVRKATKPYQEIFYYQCRCHCGKEWVSDPHTFKLKKNAVRSCGCSRKLVRGINKTHGMSGTATYKSWNGMLERCRNPNNASYPDWGGRGIRVCDRWFRFENFLEDMGEKPPGTSLDRINVNGHYEQSNCRWASPTTQRVNQRKRIRNRDVLQGLDADLAIILAH